MLSPSRLRWSGMLRPQGFCRRWMSSEMMDSPTEMVWKPDPELAAAKSPFVSLDEVAVLEERLKYKFRYLPIIEDALLHPSFPIRPRCYAGDLDLVDPPSRRSYKSLTPRGMFNLKTCLEIHMSSCTPPEGDLDVMCDLNLSPYKLARNALALGLYDFLRRDSPKLDRAVEDFTKAQQGKVLYTGIPVKVPHVLPELVLAFLGVISVDFLGVISVECKYDRMEAWEASQMLVFPLLKWGYLPGAVEQIRGICSYFNMTLDFKNKRVGNLFTTQVFVNKLLHGSSISELEDYVQGLAAMDALNKLPSYMLSGTILENPFQAAAMGCHVAGTLCAKRK